MYNNIFDLRRLCVDHTLPAAEVFDSRPRGEAKMARELSDSKSTTSGEGSPFPLIAAMEAIDSFNGIKRGDLNYYQQKALRVLDAWEADNSGPHITDMNVNQEEVRLLILSFSRLFLGSRLERSNIDFAFEEIESWASAIVSGQQAHYRNRTNEIRVHPADWSHLKGVKNHKIALMGTLFHECIHAYLAEYCCKSHDKNNVCTDGEGCPLWVSESQHSFAWICLAAGVEIALDKLLDLGADLAVFRSLIMEYKETGVRFSASEWKRMFDLHGWDGVDYLVKKLWEEEFVQLGKYLTQDEHVVDVFVEEYEKDRTRSRKKREAHDATKQKGKTRQT